MSIYSVLVSSQVPSVLFAPSHLMAIMTLGLSSALVMDCGYTETLVLPVSFAMENCDVTQQKQNVFAWAMFSHPLKVARFVKAYEPACIAFC